MKRSRLRRPTLAEVRAWEQRPRKPLARQTKPIAQLSERRLTQREQRALVVETVHRRDRVCQGGAVKALTRIEHGGPLDVHELIPRSQWAKGYLDPKNCVLLCRNHHDWVTSHAHGAHALGLRKWSWER